MDEDRADHDEPMHAQDGQHPPRAAAPTLSDRQRPDDYDEVMRANRRRLALIGLATGAVMAVIVLLCLLLLVLLSSQ